MKVTKEIVAYNFRDQCVAFFFSDTLARTCIFILPLWITTVNALAESLVDELMIKRFFGCDVVFLRY